MSDFKNTLTVRGNTVWHAGNDGSGSGLDADLLEGYALSLAATPSTVVARDTDGDILVGNIDATTLTLTSGPVGTSTPLLNLTQTWNSTSLYSAIMLNIVEENTADPNSALLDLQLGGVSQFKVSKTGGIVFAGDTNLYRASSNTLRTDDALQVGGVLTAPDVRSSGNVGWKVVSLSGDTTLGTSGTIFVVNASGGARTITLPAASSCADRLYIVKKTDNSTNPVNVTAGSGDSVDGVSTHSLTVRYDTVIVVSDGVSQWHVI